MTTDTPTTISVIIPVGPRQSDPLKLFADYKASLAPNATSLEFIYVLDGPYPEYGAALQGLVDGGEQITIIMLTRSFGEATAIAAGFEHCTGAVVLTLPAHAQVDATGPAVLVRGLDQADLVVARRWPRVGGSLEKLRRSVFHKLLSRVTHLKFRDLGCSARAMKRQVLEEIHLYGDQARFLPVLADRQGFRVREVDIPQSKDDRFLGVYGPRTYTQAFLDIFTVFFLVRFTKRPLRFFGMVGVTMLAIGLLAQLYLVIERLGFARPLADRPAFFLASLLIVLGLQIFALGLLGELIIFVHAGGVRDYQVERIIQYRDGAIPADVIAEVRVEQQRS